MTLALSIPETVSPPPPHDPADREVALRMGAWEVRLSSGRALEYFAPRGLLHAQLWHPGSRISILTPSRLTAQAFEGFPSRGWKGRARTYLELRELLGREHPTELPSPWEIAHIEALVEAIARSV